MIPIIAAPSATAAHITLAAKAAGANSWYLNAVSALWDAGVATGVDPVVLAAQCALETSWGRFGGAVGPSHHNTCGLKTTIARGDTADDHARFPADAAGRPALGALAHAHHLRLYCGFPVPYDTPDPRARYVGPGSPAYGSVTYVEELGARWAPAADYGERVARIVATIRGVRLPG